VEITFVEERTDGSCSDSYTLKRTWTATDDCGNSSSASQTITVVDTTAPKFNEALPEDATVECDAVPTEAVLTAKDNCDDDVTVVSTEVRTDGSCADGYTLTRTWTATDDCGNKVSHTQTITVVDTTKPELVGLPDADGGTYECLADVPLAVTVTATDNCSEPVVQLEEKESKPGSSCNNVITRTWTATDDCGNSTSFTQTITVKDTTKPVITSCPSDYYAYCGNCSLDPDVTGRPTATDNCDQDLTITYEDSASPAPGSCPWTITRTWTITDDCGNKETCTQKLSCVPFTKVIVTDSSLCSFDRDPATECRDFRLLFTQDTQNWPCYKVTASNPGQTYFNVFYVGAPGTAVEFNLSIPYPYVTQGAQPIHAYDGVQILGETCLVPGNGILVNGTQTTLQDYSPQQLGSIRSVQVTVTVPSTGFIYLNMHLDYGLKGTTGYGKSSDGLDNAIRCGGLNADILIPNRHTYEFGVSAGGQTATDGVCNINAFKRIPGVGGLVASPYITSDGVPGTTGIGGVPVELRERGALLTQSVTDGDGWYMLEYKWKGRATDLTVTIRPPNKPPISKTVRLKSNGYVQVDFSLP
jgi:hypothetical protein